MADKDSFPLEVNPGSVPWEDEGEDEAFAKGDDPVLREKKRQETRKDALSRALVDFINTFSQVGKWLGLIIAGIIAVLVIFIGIMVLFFLTTLVIHLFIPAWAWLTPEEQTRAAGLYGSIAQVALPLITATVPVVLWWNRRR